MIAHAFVPDPFGRDTCDAHPGEGDRIIHCGRPAREHDPELAQAIADARGAWERMKARRARNPVHFTEVADASEE